MCATTKAALASPFEAFHLFEWSWFCVGLIKSTFLAHRLISFSSERKCSCSVGGLHEKQYRWAEGWSCVVSLERNDWNGRPFADDPFVLNQHEKRSTPVSASAMALLHGRILSDLLLDSEVEARALIQMLLN